MFKAAKTHFGGVDIVINNAGIAERTPLWEDDKGFWKKVIDIDLTAVIEGTRLGIQVLREQGRGGVIVNTASLAGLYPQPLTPVYSAAKFGVIGLTRSCKEIGDGIRVNAVAPRYTLGKRRKCVVVVICLCLYLLTCWCCYFSSFIVSRRQRL